MERHITHDVVVFLTRPARQEAARASATAASMTGGPRTRWRLRLDHRTLTRNRERRAPALLRKTALFTDVSIRGPSTRTATQGTGFANVRPLLVNVLTQVLEVYVGIATSTRRRRGTPSCSSARSTSSRHEETD